MDRRHEWRVKYRREHRKEYKIYAKTYREKYTEEMKERKKKYYQEHHDEILKKKKQYRKKNKEKMRNSCKRTYEKYREKYTILRLCKKYGITVEEYNNLTKNGCVVCGVSIVDIHGTNGNHNKKNLVSLCGLHHDLITRRIVKNLEELVDYYIN